jgi:hypothetical protein
MANGDRGAWVRLPCILGLATVACGGNPPAVFVGESTHFRLYVDPALMQLPAAFAGENALDALETEWSDVATMLAMPDGKIDYYWYTPEQIGIACDDTSEGGCTKEEQMEIDAPLLPDAHELNHAYTYLRSPRRPIPFLAEGMAEAIGCGYEAPIGASFDDDDWRQAVVEVRSDRVYGLGGLFVRHMIRRHGIAEFLRYYEQSPERRDPALFAANFESFWGERIDDVWTDFTTIKATVAWVDEKICPCSLPPITPGAPIVNDPAHAPYWTVPDVGDASLAFTAPRYQSVSVRSCAGDTFPLVGKAVLARLGAGARWYVMPQLADVQAGTFVADNCADAAHYPLSPDVLVGNPYLSVTVPPTEASTVYLAIDVPFPLDTKVSGAYAMCASCDFDQDGCSPISGATKTPVTGPFYARLQFHSSDNQLQYGAVNTQVLTFSR